MIIVQTILNFDAQAEQADHGEQPRNAHIVLQHGPGGWGDPYEGTAVAALEVAFCLLDAIDNAQELRPGFGTPTWHLAHLGFYERLLSHGFPSVVEDGAPSLEFFQRKLQVTMPIAA